MSIFAKAAAKKAEKKSAPKAKKKETVWSVGSASQDEEDLSPDEKVAKAVKELKRLAAEKKAVEAKEKVQKTVILKHALRNFYSDYARNGVFPDTPMKVQNSDGEAATLVVQERNQYPVKDDSVDALGEILGEDAAAELFYEETVFGFDRAVLAKEGVMDVLGKHLEGAIEELVSGGTLGDDEAEALLDAEIKRSWSPGVLQRMGVICGKDSTKIEEVMDAMGSGCVKYIKS